MEQQVEYDYLLKFVMAGPEQTGKSSILQQYINNTFVETYMSTIGVDFAVKTLSFN